MIEIWEPRWHDRKVLIAEYKIPRGEEDFEIKITKSCLKGTYKVPKWLVRESMVEPMKTKKGETVDMVAVSLDKLEEYNGKEEKQTEDVELQGVQL